MRVAIVGAGILGLAHAYAYAKRGHKVRIYERSPQAQGASIRNFGLIWPIGQPFGEMANMANLSRRLWAEVLDTARLEYSRSGSLHLTYHSDEEAVAREFAEREPSRAQWLNATQAKERSPAIVADGLRGGLYSDSELTVDPRQVIPRIAEYLRECFDVQLEFDAAIHEAPIKDADLTIICSGADFESLYPEILRTSGMTRCKLQMMRTVPQPSGWKIGPALASGLTLRFYQSFANCESMKALRLRIAETMPDYDTWGIHVMASQMPDGSVTIGDSHKYGLTINAFNQEAIDQRILDYLATFARFPNLKLAERWHGVYAKHFDKPYCVFYPEPSVRVVTGIGGAGMTLSFGLAETLYDSVTTITGHS